MKISSNSLSIIEDNIQLSCVSKCITTGEKSMIDIYTIPAYCTATGGQ